jgi:DNA-directed RNA polymerase subunit RPC12/RpoP
MPYKCTVCWITSSEAKVARSNGVCPYCGGKVREVGVTKPKYYEGDKVYA